MENHLNKLIGLVKTINYLCNYSKMKEISNTEKYFIIFTNLLNSKFDDVEELEDILSNLKENNDANFLLVGKNEDLSNENDSFIKLDELILNKFGKKSEIIFFENMKKIKTILSNSSVIKDEIFYPNEIYK